MLSRVMPSTGSRVGKSSIVGNGDEIANEREVLLSMESPDGHGGRIRVQTTFLVADITRPLMSVGRICDQGLTCVFDKDGARIVNADKEVVSYFKREDNLYVTMQLGPPEPFWRQAP